jgi:hypothetical protein
MSGIGSSKCRLFWVPLKPLFGGAELCGRSPRQRRIDLTQVHNPGQMVWRVNHIGFLSSDKPNQKARLSG